MWRNPDAAESIKKSNPKLYEKIAELDHVRHAANMLSIANDLSLTVPWDYFDFETLSLVHELRRLQANETKQKMKHGR